MSWLTDPLQHGFMQTAFLAAALVGVSCATIGVYVVLRRMAFIGDALAHTILPGLVLAYVLGWSLLVGALVGGLASALVMSWLSRRDVVREDTAIGIVFTGMFALGILVMSTQRSFRDLSQMLFGNILGVGAGDLALIAGVAVLVLGVLVLFHKELELTSFDPLYGQIIGLSPDVIRYALLFLLALTIVVGIQAVGVVLTSALLITPAAAASLVSNRLPRMMAIATAIAVGSGVVGLYASYYFSVSSGAAIVLACTACFGVTWLARTIFAAR